MTIDTETGGQQITRYYIVCNNPIGDQMMATSTMSAATTNHFKPNNSSASQSGPQSTQESIELSSRLTQIHLKERQDQQKIPRRQPTIVCEDIADDIDFDDDDEECSIDGTGDQIGGTGGAVHSGVVRSASTASLTVPTAAVESEVEKRRPPLPQDDPMMIESN